MTVVIADAFTLRLYSQFEHCSQIWRSYCVTLMTKFEQLQKKAIKWVFHEEFLSYSDNEIYYTHFFVSLTFEFISSSETLLSATLQLLSHIRRKRSLTEKISYRLFFVFRTVISTCVFSLFIC